MPQQIELLKQLSKTRVDTVECERCQASWNVEEPFTDLDGNWHSDHGCPVYREVFSKHFRHYKRTGDLLSQSAGPKYFHYFITFTVDKKKYENAYHYLLTLIPRLLQSKLFDWENNDYCSCIEHITTNAHLHIYVRRTKFLKAQPVYNLNKKMRVEVKKLCSDIHVANTKKYISKDEPDKDIQFFLEEYLSKDI